MRVNSAFNLYSILDFVEEEEKQMSKQIQSVQSKAPQITNFITRFCGVGGNSIDDGGEQNNKTIYYAWIMCLLCSLIMLCRQFVEWLREREKTRDFL